MTAPMTTIDRAGLADEIERQADHIAPLTEMHLVLPIERWREIIAALRKPDQKGEAGFVPIDENTPDGWHVTWREGEDGWTLAHLSSATPAEEGGYAVWSSPSGHDTMANAGSYAAPTHYLPGGFDISRLSIRERHPAPEPTPEAGKLPGEEDTESNVGFVTALYRNLLGREPEVGYWPNEWVKALNRGVDRAHIIHGFIDSDEFREKYGLNGASRATRERA